MHYLVDGHNLIGRMPGLALSDPDDEAKLVDLLQRWTLGRPRDRITVVFDGGVFGHPGRLGSSTVRVLFARRPGDADGVLAKLLQQVTHPEAARLISDDRAIVSIARGQGVEVVSCRAFAAQLTAPSRTRPSAVRRLRPEPKLPRSEVDAWIERFGGDE